MYKLFGNGSITRGKTKYRDIYIFFFSFLLIITIKFIQFPSLTYNAEMFVENATNFFINAYTKDIITNLVTPDAGYLPLTQRLIALILVKGLNIVALYPYVSQLIAITFISAASSLINLNVFKNIHNSNVIRFILGLSIALISDYELNAFINFIYFGGLLLFLAILLNKEKLHIALISFITIAASIIMLSKGQFIIFIPIFVILAILHNKKKEYKSLLFYLGVIFAGFLQFFIMLANFTKSESSSSIALLPYYVVKTFYYYVLTYKHVFMGYITKEDTPLLAFAILFIIFFIAIKKLLRSNRKQVLYMFLIGNFIAVCSLFLTVYILNNNVNPHVKKLIPVLNQIKSNEKPTTEVQKIGTTIFDVKHFANLRSLFFSNLLIYLTGTLVLLSLFPKKSHKIIFLLTLFYTSGAFGQIKVEEAYATKTQSYSQWSTYHKYLQNNHYCIPINHYPALLKKNCDYLYYKDPDSLESHSKPIEVFKISNLSSYAKLWEIQAIVMINKPNNVTNKEQLVLYAYDKNGKLISKAKQLFPWTYDFIYYLFDKPVKSADHFVWKNEKGSIVKVKPDIIVFGNLTEGSKQ